ncbi:MAG TPA: dTDP-4-dehydrorhamnose 3,5-epimerase family protein [Candidatus Elarobacter sp.]|jgi:dTDP-4-dehydrorhamnose 3,5-epimerase
MSSDVVVIPLASHADARGALTEIFRAEWVDDSPVQWNVVRSEANVLRGVHVHVRHHDYVVPVSGRLLIGLSDLREGTPEFGRARMIELDADAPQLVVIPPGVAHGFCSVASSVFAYGVSDYWDPEHDELGCRWNDPELGLSWPLGMPSLSQRDTTAGTRAELLDALRAVRAAW